VIETQKWEQGAWYFVWEKSAVFGDLHSEITESESDGATNDKDVREHAKDEEEAAEKNVTVSNLNLMVANCHIYPMKEQPTVFKTNLFQYDACISTEIWGYSNAFATYIERNTRPMCNVWASGQCLGLVIREMMVKQITMNATKKSKTTTPRPGSIVVVGSLQRPFMFGFRYQLG
jgi:hypothetical protein